MVKPYTGYNTDGSEQSPDEYLYGNGWWNGVGCLPFMGGTTFALWIIWMCVRGI